MSGLNTLNITSKEYKEIYSSMSKDRLIELLIADKREIRRLRSMWLEQKQANEANKQPDTKALPLHGVVQQRELLLLFANWVSCIGEQFFNGATEDIVDSFIKQKL